MPKALSEQWPGWGDRAGTTGNQGKGSLQLKCMLRRVYKEFAPQGQGQVRDFCRDFTQPSQVVWGGTAAPDATKGLPQLGPAATAAPVQPGARFYQQGAKSPVMATWEKGMHPSCKCRKCDRTTLWLRDFFFGGGHYSRGPKIHLSGDT